MSRHYRPGESDDLDFVQQAPEAATATGPDAVTEANDDPTDDLPEIDASAADDPAGVV